MVAEQSGIDTQGLISLERSEKYDLLGQLILNQREALILCGADGIGKTTLLKTLRENRGHLWTICFLQGTVQFSFDYIKKELASAIKEHGSIPDNESVNDMLNFYEEHQQKVVLVLDNAGSLEEGLINTLIEYALEYPAIRIIFALTKEELLLKNSTDTAIDDCYFIELPSLDKQHVSIFLQTLAALPDSLIKADEVNDRLVKKLYQQTGGVPGGIVDKLEKQQNANSFKWQSVLIFTCCAFVSLILVYFYKPELIKNNSYNQFFGSFFKTLKSQPIDIEKEAVAKDAVEIKTAVVKNKERVLNGLNQQQGLLNVENSEEQKTSEPKQEEPSLVIANSIEQKKQESQSKSELGVGDNKQWVLQQPSGNYTLQLMVVPTREGLLSVLKQHQKLQDSLKYIQVLRKKKQDYVLLYGSFETRKLAQKALKTLPKDFKGAWPKRFGAVQQEIKKTP